MTNRSRSGSTWIMFAALTSGIALACGETAVPDGPRSYCLNTPLSTNPSGDTTCTGVVVTDTSDSGLYARLAQLAKVCTDGDGMVVSICPSENLLGCCQARNQPDPEETCFYSGTASYWEQYCCGGGQCPGHAYWSSTSF